MTGANVGQRSAGFKAWRTFFGASARPLVQALGGRCGTTGEVVRFATMIRSWANASTRRFAETGKSKFSGLDEDRAIELLASLDAAIALGDLSPLKSVGLHKLAGDRKGQWAMRVNGPWRICFRFADGNALDVEIVDYH